MSTINWKTATDAEKNACFAERVANQPPKEILIGTRDGGKSATIWQDDSTSRSDVQDFCKRHPEYKEAYWKEYPDYLLSADAVLPWLEKLYVESAWAEAAHYTKATGTAKWQVRAFCGNLTGIADASTFPEAAMIALLRAKGVEVVT